MNHASIRSLILTMHFAAAVAAASVPSLEARVGPDRIEIHATTASAAHRRLLRRAVSANAPTRESAYDLSDRPGLPSDWTLVSELAVRAAALLEEGTVVVSRGDVVIEGTSPHDVEIDRLVARLDALRGAAGSVSSRVIGISAIREPYAVLCRRQFFRLARDNRVDFIHAGATLRGSALPALQRLAEMLSDCPSLEVRVTGHTDSLGDAQVNQALSYSRAKAVIDYLAMLGIDERRLTATGAGNSDPLVAEDRPGARRINRRVEFSLRESQFGGDNL